MAPLIIFLGFFVYSVAVSMFGTQVGEIMKTLSIPISQAGSLLSTQQMGAFLGIVLSPLVLKHCKEKSILRLGMVVMGASLVLLFVFPARFVLFAIFACLGFGGFYVDSGSNAYLASHFPEKRSIYIPILHFVYSLGALSSGYLVLPFKGMKWHIGYAICGVLLLSFLLIGMENERRVGKRPAQSQKKQEILEKLPFKVILGDKRFLLYCLVLMFYMSSQQISASWLPLYVETAFHASPSLVAATLMSFWIGIACMRLVSPLFLSKGIPPLLLTAGGMFLSFLTLIIALLSKNLVFAYIAIVISGFGSGATIPLFIVTASSWFPANTAFVSVFYILSGTVGRMIFPYLVALFAETYGLQYSLLSSSLLLLLGSLLAIVVYRKRELKAVRTY
ncbi:MFS transporter [uncultured Sphaerochaeta sp.]|uniref:MFS transporter n=1 Tax=uncultured Sphaerochaeta sp. TaxID=886478 RepID=UPI002A0A648D|nr:MFS transporter [uncultured Sphaerochaeta sp.]